MSDPKEVEGYYQKVAERFIDALFNNGYFGKETKREDMRKVEDLLAFQFQAQAESAAECERLLRSVREKGST